MARKAKLGDRCTQCRAAARQVDWPRWTVAIIHHLNCPAWLFDTNAGPVVTLYGDLCEAKRQAVESCPLANEEGASIGWTTNGRWHVMHVYDAEQWEVHTAAFRPGHADRTIDSIAAAAHR
jgi:hypothetical protein